MPDASPVTGDEAIDGRAQDSFYNVDAYSAESTTSATVNENDCGAMGDVQQEPTITSTCHCPKWSLRPRQWVYRGEGNASLVLALPQEKKIVRLAKIDNRLRRMDSDYQFVSNNASGIRTIEETLERIVFAWKILAPLLGPRLVSPCHVYHIDLDEIEEIERALEAIRPAHRKHKRLAPVCHAIVCTDCTLLPRVEQTSEPVYCIELKPKQGFLSCGHERCPFCLNQFLKKKHGKIDVLSEYCPLDLFSGSWLRMIKAIVALTRTPQNNLRIFQDGSLVFAEECQGDLQQVLQQWFHDADEPVTDKRDVASSLPLQNFCSLVVQALCLDHFPETHSSSNNGTAVGSVNMENGMAGSLHDSHVIVNEITDEFSTGRCLHDDDWYRRNTQRSLPSSQQMEEWLSQVLAQNDRDHTKPCIPPATILLPTSVLYKLLQVQSLGDVDFQKLYTAYEDVVDRFRDGSFSYDQMRWTHPQVTADWVAGRSLGREALSFTESDVNVSIEESVRLVQRYRISSTTRDCSIMIAFQRINQADVMKTKEQQHHCLRDLSGGWYSCRTSIVDLDPKPVSCVEKHRRRNQAMNEAFLLSTLSSS